VVVAALAASSGYAGFLLLGAFGVSRALASIPVAFARDRFAALEATSRGISHLAGIELLLLGATIVEFALP
jgi:hypothetical protein